jgi:hypothetical protein
VRKIVEDLKMLKENSRMFYQKVEDLREFEGGDEEGISDVEVLKSFQNFKH